MISCIDQPNQRKKSPRTNWTGAFEKRTSLRMVLPLSPTSFHIFSWCQTSKPFLDVSISQRKQPTRSPKYLLRSQAFRHQEHPFPKYTFSGAWRGIYTAMKIEVTQRHVAFFIAIMLNSPSKKNRYRNKNMKFILPWLPMVLSSATPTKTRTTDKGLFSKPSNWWTLI